jgi:hypothetical protein
MRKKARIQSDLYLNGDRAHNNMLIAKKGSMVEYETHPKCGDEVFIFFKGKYVGYRHKWWVGLPNEMTNTPNDNLTEIHESKLAASLQ